MISQILDYKEFVKFCAIDMEDADGYKKKNGFPSNDTLVEICRLECNIFESNGFIPYIYASKYWFDTFLNSRLLDSIPKWLAWWNGNVEGEINKEKYSIWQYSSKGQIAGISGNVDLNIMFTKESKSELEKDLENYPDYVKPTIKKLIDKKVLQGEDGKINFDSNMQRIFVILDRLGLLK